ncbi:type II toxin-antitoxin system Phd/YefM family antitoxin [Rosenbergiella epipactidis]|uniref:type II toxin-antitoxin system Phd/YefM family antitoxin n=1 Tax=Rosenbergiella epipactidis TaxID=1544694 RepID=UPI001BDA8789|nr:type II toxin-antitoxin system Phd/YefM family antitoxin [Rosenbergiella epipactidis]MBT0718601.1 type II toxin-antitoxin system Phd/YefM family antitoxin [Rosenbergiella epipactidis]
MQAITFTDARKHFADTMKRVTDDAEPVRVMRRDAPDIVMIDAAEYEALIETIYLFSNPINADHINEAMKQAELGEFVKVEY